MNLFSRSPQAYIIRNFVKSPELQKTFNKNHIESLAFQEGDIVCGVYKTTKRTDHKAGFSFGPMEGYAGPPMSVRIVVTLSRNNEHADLSSDVYMWRPKTGKNPTLPLESSFGRWFHGIFIARMLGSGTQYLLGLAKSEKRYHESVGFYNSAIGIYGVFPVTNCSRSVCPFCTFILAHPYTSLVVSITVHEFR